MERKQEDTMDEDVYEAKRAAKELLEETTEIRKDFQESIQELNQQFRQIDQCFNKQRRQAKKYKQVTSLVSELESSSIDVGKETKAALSETKVMIDELGKSKRRLGSVFLRSIMGHVSVKLWNEGERLQFKQEYNRFKEAFMPIHLLLPMIQLYFGWSLTIHQIQSFFTFYYYTSLAIRENILSVNGSRIEAWWIYHHYVTLVSALFFLLVSDNHPLVAHGVSTMCNINLLWQSMVMLVQNNYQRKRHYTRKALAKKTAMDVRTTEVIDENPQSSGLYRFLIPALFFTYAFQLLIGLSIIYVIYHWGTEFETFAEYLQGWGLVLCWLFLPIGNVITLLKVLSRKNPSKFDISRIVNRKAIGDIIFFTVTVGKSIGQTWALYGLHLFKSVKKQSSKLLSSSSRKHHSSSSSKKKHDRKSKDKSKDKENDKDNNKDNDSSVTTKKKS